jgi:uncharacterized protein YuzE
MRIRYFKETDSLYVEFRDRPVAETRDLGENTLLDVDAGGNICAITVEPCFESGRHSGILVRRNSGLTPHAPDGAHRIEWRRG